MSKKKVVKKQIVEKKVNYKNFDEWWSRIASKKVDKIEKSWIRKNKPNDPSEDGGGDHWHVNEMMHNGDAHEMTWEVCKEIFEKGEKGEDWSFEQYDSLYCELDDVIDESYLAGRKIFKG